MEFSIEGLDDLERNIEEIRKGLEELDGEHSIPFEELFPPSFMNEFTEFDNIDQMINKSGYQVQSSEDFENIPDDQWSDFVSGNTQFHNWNEMLNEAVSQWAAKKLGF
jgi:hypothetical protein